MFLLSFLNCWLIITVIAYIFIPTAVLAIPKRIPMTEPKAEIETHPVAVEVKIIKCAV